MALPIVHYNSPVLRAKGVPVTQFDAKLVTLAEQMVETMHAAQGIGLAAQQVGLAMQFCVVDLSQAERDFTWTLDGATPPLELIQPMALANPKFTVLPGDVTVYEEGCLSFPKINGDVDRPDRIKVTYQDVYGTPHELLCDGLLARCIQHEIDHLNGVLFIDRMAKRVRAKILPDVRELAERTKAAEGK